MLKWRCRCVDCAWPQGFAGEACGSSGPGPGSTSDAWRIVLSFLKVRHHSSRAGLQLGGAPLVRQTTGHAVLPVPAG